MIFCIQLYMADRKMANINIEMTKILNESRGEDVRDAFTDACEKISSELLPNATTEGYFLTVNSSGEWEALPWT